MKTVYDVFMHGHEISRDNHCLGWRPGPKQPYMWLTYDEVCMCSLTLSLHESLKATFFEVTFLKNFSQIPREAKFVINHSRHRKDNPPNRNFV